MERLDPSLGYDPEQVFYLNNLRRDAAGETHVMMRRPEGDGFVVSFSPEAFPYPARWLLRNADLQVAAIALPSTCHPEGYLAEKSAGHVRSLKPATAANFRVRLGYLDARRRRENGRHHSEPVTDEQPHRRRRQQHGRSDHLRGSHAGPRRNDRGAAFRDGPGGKGANQAVAAARLGSEVLMVSKVGDDVFGQNTIRNFQNNGIDTRHVDVVAGVSSGVAPIFVEPSGENSILIIKGANGHLPPADVDAAAGDLLALRPDPASTRSAAGDGLSHDCLRWRATASRCC